LGFTGLELSLVTKQSREVQGPWGPRTPEATSHCCGIPGHLWAVTGHFPPRLSPLKWALSLTRLSALGAIVSVIQEPKRDPMARMVMGLLTPVSFPQPGGQDSRREGKVGDRRSPEEAEQGANRKTGTRGEGGSQNPIPVWSEVGGERLEVKGQGHFQILDPDLVWCRKIRG
jgi:hypothetical protein